MFSHLNTYGQRIIYAVDTVESQISWYCGNHYGCIKPESGYVSLVEGKISSGSFNIDMNTIHDDDIVDNDMLRATLDNVLKSEDFFDSKAFPYSVFTIMETRKIDNNNYIVSGILKIKDKANDIRFDSEIFIDEDRFVVQSQIINIDRTKWGINIYSKKHDPKGRDAMVVPDIISLKIYLVAYKIKRK